MVDNNISEEDSKMYFINSDNLKLFQQIWKSEKIKEIRAVVFIIHGLNEHSSFCYENTVAQPLVNIGCMVMTHDHVGHGRSEGNRKVIARIEDLARDVISHIEYVRQRNSISDKIPTFLYGHSLGGLIACIISLRKPNMISGMVLEAPALFVDDKPGSAGISFMVARMLSVIMPSMILHKPIFTNLSRNPEVVQSAIDDIFRNKDGLTLGTAVNITNAVLSMKTKLKDIQTPFFVAHGGKDSIVSMCASQILQKEAAVEDKSFQMYSDSFHLLRGDIDDVGEDFKRRTVQWIDNHIK